MNVERDTDTKSLSYKIDGGIVYVTVIGKLRIEEQRGFTREMQSDPALPSPLRVLRDARKQVGLIDDSAEGLQPFITIAENLKSSVPAGSRMAIVASNDLVFGMSRVFQAHLDENVSVFRDYESTKVVML